jgi:Flp pilus assembly protein TadD
MTTTHAGQTNREIRQRIGQAFELLQRGQLDDASRLSQDLLAAHGEHAEVLYLAGEVELARNQPQQALALIDRAIAIVPRQPPLLLKKARVLLALRQRTQARAVAAETSELVGNDARGLWAIGQLYNSCNDPLKARSLFERALAAGLRDPAMLYDLASAEFFLGEFDSAEEHLDALLKNSRAGQALYLRATLRRQTPERTHIEDLEASLAKGFADDVGRAACLYALAKECEDVGQDNRAFRALSEGARLMRSQLQYDAATERATIDAIAEAWTAETMQAESAGCDDAGAIFIVGMPRTGTTLVERTLDRHSEVSSAGELLDFGLLLARAAQQAQAQRPELSLVEASRYIDFAALGRDYMDGARQAAAGTPCFIDKMPVNYMYCGLIRKALPKARIIHLVRDPMDSCYAVYKTLFNQAYSFSYDLTELADYYISYERLMRHWHQVMPDGILDVHYEDLVMDTEGQARRLLAWCELEWQPEVLDLNANASPASTASAAQVREPVHAGSIGKWKTHADGLAPLLEKLQAAGLATAEG